MRRASRVAPARQTASVALSPRVRQGATVIIVVVVKARRASMPRSMVRSSAVSGLTAMKCLYLMAPQAGPDRDRSQSMDDPLEACIKRLRRHVR